MKAFLPRQVLWLATGVLLAAGTVVSVRSMAQRPAARERIARKQAELAQLRRLEISGQSVRSALRTVESLDEAALGSQAALPAPPAGGAKPDDVHTETRAFGDGWVEVAATASFRDASLRDVMALVDLASAARPPWRLASCDIRASPRGAGAGQAALVFATVRRGGGQ